MAAFGQKWILSLRPFQPQQVSCVRIRAPWVCGQTPERHGEARFSWRAVYDSWGARTEERDIGHSWKGWHARRKTQEVWDEVERGCSKSGQDPECRQQRQHLNQYLVFKNDSGVKWTLLWAEEFIFPVASATTMSGQEDTAAAFCPGTAQLRSGRRNQQTKPQSPSGRKVNLLYQ